MTPPAQCLDWVRQLLAKEARHILGIAAAPGAGKSTLACLLAQQFEPFVQVLPMDGFHLSNSALCRLQRAHRKGACDTFDALGFVHLIKRLKVQKADEIIYAPEFNRDIDEAVAGAIAISPETRLIITEGNYLLLDQHPWSDLAGLLDDIWFLEVDDAQRGQRLLARHMQFGRSETDAKAWMSSTDEPNAVLIKQHRHRARRVLNWS